MHIPMIPSPQCCCLYFLWIVLFIVICAMLFLNTELTTIVFRQTGMAKGCGDPVLYGSVLPDMYPPHSSVRDGHPMKTAFPPDDPCFYPNPQLPQGQVC